MTPRKTLKIFRDSEPVLLSERIRERVHMALPECLR
jgi:hypothetical protein